ncbi:redox-sensing transcriptional repressor Rex [Rubeoparvulum massiliense]|uniref:redox-sensing transcriptional repressor Rex n=1 Tax=Rubeoparvulum massiliense TaxID=1631346 RepID=UPI00065E7705|nr:redox-sensing transcriptional repressor Rex [Rubeoparvulum massiliense]
MGEKPEKISESVVRRLPIYLRYCHQLQKNDVKTVSSKKLGELLQLNPAQIRKDLAYFGEFGRKGVGYEVDYLVSKIEQILHVDQIIPIVVIGAGSMGHALCKYNDYLKQHMQIVAILDHDHAKVGKVVHHLQVEHIDQLNEIVAERKIKIGIIAVPSHAAQDVCNQLMDAGIHAILNFAPIRLKTRPGVRVQQTDVARDLHTLAFYLTGEE